MQRVSVCLGLLVFFLMLSAFLIGDVWASKYQIPEASEGQINEALQKTVPIRFLPTQTFYFLIRAKEAFNEFFQPSSLKKARFDAVLSGKRLKEVYRMLEGGQNEQASKNLLKYKDSNNRLIKNLERARQQNQEVVPIVLEIAEDLKNQEVLLFGIYSKKRNLENDSVLDENLDKAVGSFVDVALKINEFKQGLKDRFKTVVWWEGIEINDRDHQPSPSPEPFLFESTASIRPKRIIY